MWRRWSPGGLSLCFALCLLLPHSSFGQTASGTTSVDLNALRGRELRVYYNINPPSVTYDESTGKYGGYLVRLLDTASLQAGFSVKAVNLSAEASAKSTVPWVACPLDAAAGRVDLCLGTWWETPARRELTAFTSTVFPATFMLLAKTSSASSPGFAQVFYPFQYELWGLLAASIAAVSLVLFALEVCHSDDFEAAWSKPYSAAVSLFLGYVGFLQAGPMHTPRTMPGRLIVIGYAFLILVVTASYTANLAASLTVANSKVGFSSMADVERAGGSVCLSPDVYDSVAAKYAVGMNAVDLSMEAARAVLGPLTGANDPSHDGTTCDAAVIYLEEFDTKQEGDLCHLQVVGKPLFNIPVAFPCSPVIEPVLSYFITAHRANGDISSWMPPVTNKCSSVTQSATTERLSVDQMKGAFGIFGACVGAGLLLATVQHGMQLLGAARRGGAGPGKSGSKVEALVEEGADTEALLRSLIASVGRLEREVSELRSGKAGSLSSAGDGHTVQPAWT